MSGHAYVYRFCLWLELWTVLPVWYWLFVNLLDCYLDSILCSYKCVPVVFMIFASVSGLISASFGIVSGMVLRYLLNCIRFQIRFSLKYIRYGLRYMLVCIRYGLLFNRKDIRYGIHYNLDRIQHIYTLLFLMNKWQNTFKISLSLKICFMMETSHQYTLD